MKAHARWEIGFIVVFCGVVAIVRTKLPGRIELGEAVLGMAALLLVQGLLRDLAKLRASRAMARSGAAPRITCVCAESTLGLTAIFAGMLLVFAMSPVVIRVPPLAWPALAGFVTCFGFVTRHLVLDWRAWRLRWEPHHEGIVVWKK